MDAERLKFQGLLPKCTICNCLLCDDKKLKVFVCLHPVCERCALEHSVEHPGMYYCPVDRVAHPRLYDMDDLEEKVRYVYYEGEGVQASALTDVIEQLKSRLNYMSRCLDPNCGRCYCPRFHEPPSIDCPLGAYCWRTQCWYNHPVVEDNGAGLQAAGEATGINYTTQFSLRLYQDAGVVVYQDIGQIGEQIEESDVGIKSKSMYLFLTSGNPPPLQFICGPRDAAISIAHFRQSTDVRVKWVFGSLKNNYSFSDKDSEVLEREYGVRTSTYVQVTQGVVSINPLFLIVANAAYMPVYRLAQMKSQPYIARLTIQSRLRSDKESIKKEILQHEITQLVHKDISSRALEEVVNKYRLHVEFDDRFNYLTGYTEDVKKALLELQQLPPLDCVKHVFLNDELVKKLLSQIAKQLQIHFLNNLAIGEQWNLFSAMNDVITFDTTDLGLRFTDNALRDYHLILNGNSITGCITDVVTASRISSSSSLNRVIAQLDPASASVVEVNGHLLEMQLLPSRDHFADWYFTQTSDHELLPVSPSSQTFASISTLLFNTGCKNGIVEMKEVHSKPLHLAFIKRKAEVSKAMGKEPQMKQLFHGSRKLNPLDMLASGEGFSHRLGIGSWGIGYYFAEKASKVLNYAYESSDKNCVILLCDVIIGENRRVLSDQQMRRAPDGLHSVLGKARGSDMYVVYESDMAYPTYLITLLRKEAQL